MLFGAKFQCRRLGIKVGAASIYHKTNRETMVDIADSVRGKDVYIIQTGTKYVLTSPIHFLIKLKNYLS